MNTLQCHLLLWAFSRSQPVMHVNGAPQMMQPVNMGVVPGPMPVPGPVPGPGPGPGSIGPPGNHCLLHTAGHSSTDTVYVELICLALL